MQNTILLNEGGPPKPGVYVAVVALQTDSRPLRQTLVQFPTPCLPVCVVDPRFTCSCSGKKEYSLRFKECPQPGVVNLGQFYVWRHRLTGIGIGCHRYGRKSSKWIFSTKSLIRAQTFILYSAQSAEQAETYVSKNSCLDISFKIYLSQLVWLEGKHDFWGNCDLRNLYLQFLGYFSRLFQKSCY